MLTREKAGQRTKYDLPGALVAAAKSCRDLHSPETLFTGWTHSPAKLLDESHREISLVQLVAQHDMQLITRPCSKVRDAFESRNDRQVEDIVKNEAI